MTSHEDASFIEGLREKAREQKSRIRDLSIRLETILASYNTFDIIALATFFNYFVDPETTSESNHPGNPLATEHLALLALKHEFIVGPLEPIPPTIVQELLDSSKEVAQLAMLARIFSKAGRSNASASLSELCFRAEQSEFYVRKPAYDHHATDVFRGLFVPFNAVLARELGYAVDEAIGHAVAFPSIIERRVNSRMSRARTHAGEIRKAVKRFRRRKSTPQTIPRDLLAALAPLRGRNFDAQLQSLVTAWLTYALGDTLSITPQDLMARSGLSEASCRAFLDSLVLPFGSVPGDYEAPDVSSLLKSRPLLRHADRYLCPSPALLLWSLPLLWEEILNRVGGTTWEQYQLHRHDFLLDKTLALLSRALPNGLIHSHLYYYPTGANDCRLELDGLIELDHLVFLIEAKGGSLSESGRRGAPRRLERKIGDLIGGAANQCSRAAKHILASERPAFETRAGECVAIERRGGANIVRVSVHLEPLGHLTAALGASEDLGLFPQGEMPWMVCLYDLYVIADCITFEAELPHYIARRLRIARQGSVSTYEELDYFGHYLTGGLYFDPAEKTAEVTVLGNFTEQFDRYYAYVTGARKGYAPRPAQVLGKSVSALLAGLQVSKLSGYLDAGVTILDMDLPGRREFDRLLKKVADRYSRDGEYHDMTVISSEDEGLGVTYMCGREAGPLVARLQQYIRAKKYEQRLRRWIGIAGIPGGKDRIVAVEVLDEPWEEDVELATLARRLLPESK